ncbi:MAG: hypothetical protein U0X39_07805 [Bacteroidales bacterium]
MEKLFYDLSKQEFSKSKKVLLWIFSGLFLLAGVAVVFMNVVLHNRALHISYSAAPFGIGLAVGIVAILATTKRKDNYFIIDDEKVEYVFGMFKTVKITHFWKDVSEIHLPHKEKKVKLIYKDNTQHVLNLNWLDKKKSHFIRKHIFYAGKEKNIAIQKVNTLSHT